MKAYLLKGWLEALFYSAIYLLFLRFTYLNVYAIYICSDVKGSEQF